MVDTQERVLAFFALDCHYMKCVFIRPAVCTQPVTESRNLLEYSSLVIKVLLKLTVKKRVLSRVKEN